MKQGAELGREVVSFRVGPVAGQQRLGRVRLGQQAAGGVGRGQLCAQRQAEAGRARRGDHGAHQRSPTEQV